MIPPPVSGQHPLEMILQELFHRANLLGPGVPTVIVKGGEHPFVFVPSEMITSEKEAILVEQTHMAPGVTWYGNESQVSINLDRLVSADDPLRIAQASIGVGTMHDPLTAKA